MVINMAKKNVHVNFVKYEEYEPHPITVATLGTVTPEQAQAIMTAFTNIKNRANVCMMPSYIDFNQHVSLGNRFSSVPPYTKFANLNMNGMFYYNDYPLCGNGRHITKEERKIKLCARSFKAGKCTDEFIKNTLGVILFPQHYAKYKQK